MLTRMFAYFTLVMYLVVGSVAMRVLMPETTVVSLPASYLSLFSPTEIKESTAEVITSPEMHFAEITFPVEKKAVQKKIIVKKPVQMVVEKVAKNELPFHEPIKLQAVVMKEELATNLVALYKDFSFEMVARSTDVKDEVSTTLASTLETEAEPAFFDYADQKVVEAPRSTENNEITKTEVIHNVDNVKHVDNKEEVIAIDDLLAFDYSKAEEDLKAQTLPVVGTVTTQAPKANTHKTPKTSAPAVAQSNSSPKPEAPVTTQEETSEKNSLLPATYPVNMTIQITGTDLDKSSPEAGFEIRFQDDLSASVQDYNAGFIKLEDLLAEPRMTRSLAVLKRGFAPTNTDIILDSETTGVSIPMIDQEKFNELLAPFEARGAIGAVLVELDDQVEGATLDVPYSQVLRLDGDLKITESDDFRYQLFVGAKAGNALLSYKDMKETVTSKIIHIHEREVTFDSNYFEEVLNEKVKLLEEDLLAKEKTPLVIASSSVVEFATTKTATKINNHTYETSFTKTLLGSRKYLELNHQSEPIFVGFKEHNSLDIPSENFMRYILSKFEDSNLGNRCLIQVNLSKKVLKVDVGSESVGSSLMTYIQILDADGKFYDSAGPKSRKIIVVGENQGAPDYAQDAKVNFKISYQDGSVQYLNSYCSPNSYLVEQL